MSRTLTALFDTRADAEAGRTRLTAAGVHADNIQIHDQDSMGSNGGYSTHNDRGVWNNTKNAFLPDEDRHTYAEGIQRGGYLLSARVPEGLEDQAADVLERSEPLDMDAQQETWRSGGWRSPAAW